MTRQITLIALIVALAIAQAHAPAWAQQRQRLSGKLVIEGTGDSQELLRALARRFESLHPGTKVDIPRGVGSRVGIISVLEGRAEVARVSRPLNENERRPGITYEMFAQAPVVFAVDSGVRLSELSSEQIVGIYSGKYVNWKQLGGAASRIHPAGRESTDPSRMTVNRHISGFADISEPVSKTFYTTSALVEAMARHKGTVGYAPLAMVKNTDLRVLKVDGVYPLVMNVRDGKYKMVIPLGIVYGKEPGPLALEFIRFLHGKEARKIIIQFGCMPADM
jgi:phosphate transport system substrate-binding protein